MAWPPTSPKRTAWIGATVLALITLVVYLPAMQGGFIWDDDRMVTENSAIKTGSGLYSIWLGSWGVDFVPLTLSSFWLEWHLWGAHAAGFHIVNIVLHAANAILLWRVLEQLGVPGGWLAALLFAVHPVSAGTASWIAERKNTLSMLFFWLSLWWFLRFDESSQSSVNRTNGMGKSSEEASSPRPSPPESCGGEGEKSGLAPSEDNAKARRLYWLSWAAFFLALLSKSSVIMLPMVLLLLAWWRRGRITGEDLRRTIPFFVLAAFMGFMGLGVQTKAVHHGVGVIHDSVLVRLLGGSWAVWFYLGMVFWPTNLMLIYPRWEIDPRSVISYLPALALIGLLLLFWRFRRSWGRPALFALGYFIVALSPALGLADIVFFTNSRVADHFQYLALPGIVALVAAMAMGTQWLAPRVILVAAAAALAGLAWQREIIFADDGRLWEDNLAKNSNSWKVCMNLSIVRLEQHRLDDAIALKKQADALLQARADAAAKSETGK